MAIITYPLNGISYDATDAETYLCSRTSGVFDGEKSFPITLTGGRTVSIGKGLAWIRNDEFAGKSVCSTEPVSLTHDIADGSLNRYDRIVLRFDNVGRRSFLTILKGTPSANPVAPAITRNNNIYDLGLYLVYIPSGSTSINLANVTDTRNDASVCGRMSDGTTGQAEIYELVREAVESVNKLKHITNIILPANGWTNSVPYTQSVTVMGVTADDFPDWYIDGEPTDAEFESYSYITSLTTSDNTLTFKCASDKPKVNVKIMLKGI